MKKKTQKRFELVKDYLLKICDRGHHTLYNVSLTISPEELTDFLIRKPPKNLDGIKIQEFSEWDKYLKGKGRSNTTKLIQRDVNLYRCIEKICTQEKIKPYKAMILFEWPSSFGNEIGFDEILKIYKKYVPIFRLTKKEKKCLNFSLRDGAAYALREMKTLTGKYPIARPTGIIEDIHRILELPFEEDIEKEIAAYQIIREKAFKVTFIHSLRLKCLSLGDFKIRFENRSEKIRKTMQKVSSKCNFNFEALITIYHHYRLIEAEDNGQDRFKVYERLQSDLEDIKRF